MDHQHPLIKASQQMNPRCPICDVKYNIQRIQILTESDHGILSHFTCENCASSFIATVTETPFGHMASGLLTDLHSHEVMQFAENDPVTHDDVLDVHEQLERGGFENVTSNQ